MAALVSPAGVLIVGGGVAALEALMALRDVAGDRVLVTLVAPPERYMRAAEQGEGAADARGLWWPPTKIAGRYLAAYLYEREAAALPGPAPEGFADLEVPLDTADAAPVRG
jgi:sulfide:quinone oxidoreductase